MCIFADSFDFDGVFFWEICPLLSLQVWYFMNKLLTQFVSITLLKKIEFHENPDVVYYYTSLNMCQPIASVLLYYDTIGKLYYWTYFIQRYLVRGWWLIFVVIYFLLACGRRTTQRVHQGKETLPCFGLSN